MALRYLLNLTAFPRSPFLRTVIPAVGLAYGIQAAVAVPSIFAQTERFYDLSGSLTYISCTAASLYLPALRARLTGVGADAVKSSLGTAGLGPLNWRQVALSAAVGVWATRLGSYLFSRITSDDGQDSRFDGIRASPPKFLGAFVAQATWVSLCLLPVLSLNAIPTAAFASAALPAVTATDVLGVALFVGGFAFEVLADLQKNRWVREKKEKKHSEEFLTRGLWGKSRHPNYFGEITLWTGIATLAGGVLASSAGQRALGWSATPSSRLFAVALCAASPAFTSFLLTKVSGIPLSEGKYDKRYGDRKDYQAWKKNTPVLIPKIF